MKPENEIREAADFRAAIAAYIREQARPADKFSHQPRLYQLARQIGAGLEYDDDVLYAAAWLHDLGVFLGHRPEDPVALAKWNNVAYAAEKAPELLREFSFPAGKIPRVVEVIRNHQPAGKPGSVEGTILRDADILEQLGATGILRTISKVGRDTRYPTHREAVQALRDMARDLPRQLQLPAAQLAAHARLKLMDNFLHAVEAEGWEVEGAEKS